MLKLVNNLLLSRSGSNSLRVRVSLFVHVSMTVFLILYSYPQKKIISQKIKYILFFKHLLYFLFVRFTQIKNIFFICERICENVKLNKKKNTLSKNKRYFYLITQIKNIFFICERVVIKRLKK